MTARRRTSLLLLISLATFGWAQAARPSSGPPPEELIATVSRPPKTTLRGVTLDEGPVPVEKTQAEKDGESPVQANSRAARAVIRGHLRHGTPYTLTIKQGGSIVFEDGDRFTISVPVRASAPTFLEVVGVDAHGNADIETWEIKTQVDDAGPFASRSWLARHSVSPSIGLSSISYSQTSKEAFSGWALTAKLGVIHPFKDSAWDIGGNAYFTALPLHSSIDDVNVRYLGVNLRVGYALPFCKGPWKCKALGGLFYTTMFVTDDRFGFENLFSPQVFPTIAREVSTRDSVSAYVKYAALTNGFSILALSNRELAIGMAWTRSLKSTRALTLSTDASDLRLSTQGIDLFSRSLTLSCGFHW